MANLGFLLRDWQFVDLTLTYCGNPEFGHISTISLVKWLVIASEDRKSASNRIFLATTRTGQVQQAAALCTKKVAGEEVVNIGWRACISSQKIEGLTLMRN